MLRPALPQPSHTQGMVLGLGTTQTLGWASSYYLPALLAAPMAHDLGLATHWVLAAFSWALVVSALMGPVAGWAIDRWGGRPVMSLASLGFAAGLGLLSQVQGAPQLFLAWSLLGMAMAAGLYEAAFATVVKFDPAGHHGHHADGRAGQHRGLATDGLADARAGLARRLPGVGGAACGGQPAHSSLAAFTV